MKKFYLYTLPIIGLFALASMNVDAAKVSSHERANSGKAHAANTQHEGLAENQDMSKAKPDALDGTMAMNDSEEVDVTPSSKLHSKPSVSSQKQNQKTNMVKTAASKDNNKSAQNNATSTRQQNNTNIASADQNNSPSMSGMNNDSADFNTDDQASSSDSEPSYD